MSIRFVLNEKLCSGCGVCSVACSELHGIDPSRGDRPLRWILSDLDRNGMPRYRSLSCRHCANPQCVEACPVGALYREENGLVLFDPDSCLACGACESACPFEAISYTPGGVIQKCDGCIDRIRAGLQPACTRTCPTGALYWEKA